MGPVKTRNKIGGSVEKLPDLIRFLESCDDHWVCARYRLHRRLCDSEPARHGILAGNRRHQPGNLSLASLIPNRSPLAGRPPKLPSKQQQSEVEVYQSKQHRVQDICDLLRSRDPPRFISRISLNQPHSEKTATWQEIIVQPERSLTCHELS